MYKVIKREVFKNGELTETEYEIWNDNYLEMTVGSGDWEEFKKVIAEAK